MKVAALQHDVVWEDAAATRAHLEPMVAGAAAAGARLVVLTEMFATGFSLDPGRIAEDEGGRDQRLAGRAGQASTTSGSAGPCPRSRPERRGRATCWCWRGRVARRTATRRSTRSRYAREHERYDAGTEHVTVDVEDVRVSLFVCYDLRFADEFWGLAERTDLYVVVANWPESRRHHWRSLLVARAIENQAYVIGVNRVGEGGGLEYVGDSMVVDPVGEVLASRRRSRGDARDRDRSGGRDGHPPAVPLSL